MKPEDGKFKDFILKSGIPLEISVVNKLKKFDVEDWGEIEYERDHKFFTTDVRVVKDFTTKRFGINFNFSIECKYKARDHRWVFMQFPSSEYGYRTSGFNEVFDQFVNPFLKREGVQLEKRILYELSGESIFDLPEADKGVDIFQKGFMESPIMEAISQAVFGATFVHYDAIDFWGNTILHTFRKQEKLGGLPLIISTVPVVVTTAEIFKIKQDTNLDDLEKVDDINSLVERVPGVAYNYTNESVLRKFTDQLWEKNPISMSIPEEFWEEIPNFSEESFKNIHPGMVYIINYSNLEEVFPKGLKRLENITKQIDDNIVPLSNVPIVKG